ncbi:hypothetical protein H5410_016659 [Solanum commersonii]|uniref:Uncharacterized protein n=1 Tax=Solanum commersonii TaxID=4109 RepID=A0A9J5ZXM5_SOLCO|nr:hypothetical protein H5410_016659 [Solanum commersonii]
MRGTSIVHLTALFYEYAYKTTANPFEQNSCKLGSVVLEGHEMKSNLKILCQFTLKTIELSNCSSIYDKSTQFNSGCYLRQQAHIGIFFSRDKLNNRIASHHYCLNII